MSKRKYKYPKGGQFWKHTGEAFENFGRASLDTPLTALGLGNIIPDTDYKGTGANIASGYSNIVGGIGKAALPIAASAAGGPVAGMAVNSAQSAIGQYNPQGDVQDPSSQQMQSNAMQMANIGMQFYNMGQGMGMFGMGGQFYYPDGGRINRYRFPVNPQDYYQELPSETTNEAVPLNIRNAPKSLKSAKDQILKSKAWQLAKEREVQRRTKEDLERHKEYIKDFPQANPDEYIKHITPKVQSKHSKDVDNEFHGVEPDQAKNFGLTAAEFASNFLLPGASLEKKGIQKIAQDFVEQGVRKGINHTEEEIFSHTINELTKGISKKSELGRSNFLVGDKEKHFYNINKELARDFDVVTGKFKEGALEKAMLKAKSKGYEADDFLSYTVKNMKSRIDNEAAGRIADYRKFYIPENESLNPYGTSSSIYGDYMSNGPRRTFGEVTDKVSPGSEFRVNGDYTPIERSSVLSPNMLNAFPGKEPKVWNIYKKQLPQHVKNNKNYTGKEALEEFNSIQYNANGGTIGDVVHAPELGGYFRKKRK